MSSPIPLDSKHGREIWRKNIQSDKDHHNACNRFFCVHARDLLLHAFDVLDAMQARAEQSDAVSRILADIAAKFAWPIYQCSRCLAGGVTCDEPERGCTGCQYRDDENENCTAPEDYACKSHCAPNLLKYAQQKAEAGK